MSLVALHVVRRLIGVGELDRVAPADRHRFRLKLKAAGMKIVLELK